MEQKHEQRQRRLRTWLVNMINSGTVENLEWVNEDKTMFKIPWKHESRNDWQPDHARIFTEWARFTGKYVEGRDKPDYKMFKTRLRCAFNKAPDIEEVPDLRKYKGINPYRVYQLLKSDRKMPGSTISDKKVINVARSSRPMNHAVAALRNKLFANSNQVPPHVESLQVQAPEAEAMSDCEVDVESEYDDPYGRAEVKRKYYPTDNKPYTSEFNGSFPNREIHYSSQQPKVTVALPLTSMPLTVSQPAPLSQIPIKSAPQNSYFEEKYEKPEVASTKPYLTEQNQQQPSTKNYDAKEFKIDQAKGNGDKANEAAPVDQQSLVLLQSTRYRSTLLKNLHNLQKDGILCDLLLRSSGGQVIPVHANVMCASSPFFKEKVDHWEVGHSGDTMDSCMTIEFTTIPFDILNSIIQFVYMGEFEVARTALPIVSNAAREMRLDDLIILCDHVLKALRNSGNLMDDKSGKPVLPKQAPLMGFPTAQSKKQSSTSHASHMGTAPINSFANQRSVDPPPTKKAAMSPLIIPAPSQDDWHIPVGKGRLASSKPSGTPVPNPLDVLCQAVDETIRTESQSDTSDTEKSPMVIDESQNNSNSANGNDGESAYSPPPLPITRALAMPLINTKPRTPMTVQLPTTDHLQLAKSLSMAPTAKVVSTQNDTEKNFKVSVAAAPVQLSVSTVAEAKLLLPRDKPTIVALPDPTGAEFAGYGKLGASAPDGSVDDESIDKYQSLSSAGELSSKNIEWKSSTKKDKNDAIDEKSDHTSRNIDTQRKYKKSVEQECKFNDIVKYDSVQMSKNNMKASCLERPKIENKKHLSECSAKTTKYMINGFEEKRHANEKCMEIGNEESSSKIDDVFKETSSGDKMDFEIEIKLEDLVGV